MTPPQPSHSSGAFPDTGPGSEGRRSREQWKNAMAEDMALVRMNVDNADEPGLDEEARIRLIRQAQNEARRLVSDLGRYAEEVLDLDRSLFR